MLPLYPHLALGRLDICWNISSKEFAYVRGCFWTAISDLKVVKCWVGEVKYHNGQVNISVSGLWYCAHTVYILTLSIIIIWVWWRSDSTIRGRKIGITFTKFVIQFVSHICGGILSLESLTTLEEVGYKPTSKNTLGNLCCGFLYIFSNLICK